MVEVTERLRATPSAPAALPRHTWARWLLPVGIPTVLVALHMQLYGRWIVDDAAITFAYARSLAAGEGTVLQPGADPVEGYSNPAWLAILVLGRWLGVFDRGAWFGVPDLVMFPKFVALLCCAGVFAGFYAVARAVSRRPVLLTVVAGMVTAAVPSFVIWVSSGLENPLLALAVVTLAALLAWAAVARRLLEVWVAVGCGLLAALAALTRPDGLIYAAAYPLAVLLFLQPARVPRVAQAAVVSTLAFVVPAGAYLAWRLATFGEYLPNTALAKAQGVPTAEEWGRPSELVAYTGWLTVVLVVGVIAAAMLQRGRGRTVLTMLLVPLGLAVAAFAVLEADWMGEYRFATPVWPLTALAASVAGARVLPQLAARAQAGVAVVALVAVWLTGHGWVSAAERFRKAPTVPMCAVAQNIGTSVNGFADILGVPGGTLVTPDVGGSALTSRFEIIDLAGLASAPIAQFWRAGDMPGLRDYVFDEVRPAFIETHGFWSEGTGIVADPRITADYVPVHLTDDRSGWWVRRDLVPSRARLAAAREWAATVAVSQIMQYGVDAPRSSCGDTLTPGTAKLG